MKISIIIPIYNGEKYLDKCLESVASQTYADFEVILVNDGSKDNSKTICEKWAKQDPRFILYNNENHGVSYSRNFGIDKASGEYIMFIDCDDYIPKETLQTFQELNNDYDLIIANYYKFSLDNKTDTNIEIQAAQYSKQEFLKSFWKLYSSYLVNQPWAKLYKTSIIKNENIRFPTDYELGEDLIFNLQYIDKSNTFCTSNKYVYYYRENGSSLTSKYRDNYLEIQLSLNEKIKDLFIKYNCYNEEIQAKMNADTSNIIISSVQNLFLPTCKLSRKEVKQKLKRYLARPEIEEIKDVKYSRIRLKVFKRMIEKKRIRTIILYSRIKEWIRKILK